MKGRRIRQPGLFDAIIPPAEPPMPRRTETLAMLGVLLVEAIVGPGEPPVTQPMGDGDDQDQR